MPKDRRAFRAELQASRGWVRPQPDWYGGRGAGAPRYDGTNFSSILATFCEHFRQHLARFRVYRHQLLQVNVYIGSFVEIQTNI